MLIASRLTLRRPALAAATLLVACLATLVAVAPAAAGKTAACAKQVIADWYDNGRVDKIYPLPCYRQAIKILPVDVRDYSSAREDILRALAYAEQGDPDPGDPNASGDPSNPGGTPGDPGTPSGPTGNPGGGTTNPVDTSGPSAVPIPLIVLAAIAGLLLVLGAAGYVTRRAAGRRDGDGPGPPAT